jgi:hypothetical protein
MTKVDEIKRLIGALPIGEINELAEWINGRLQRAAPIRDHSAFLNGYSPEDEGLYDDAATR